MKEILQTKYLNHKINLACADSHTLAYSCILHVENVDQEYVAVEEEAAVEDQEGQQLQELEAVEPVEEQEFELANPYQQPGKHRFIYPKVLHSFKFGASTGSILTQRLY